MDGEKQMKKVYFLAIAVVLVGVMASCASKKTTSKTETTARCLEPIVADLYADLDVNSAKTMGECSWEGAVNEDVDIEDLKRIAVYNALTTHKADVLVAPQFKVKTDTYARKTIKVTVTGYPATYTNFHHSPVVNTVEAKELKSDATYLLKSQTNDNQTIGYQVIVPVEKSLKTIDIDQTTLDKIVLSNTECSKHPVCTDRNYSVIEPEGVTLSDKSDKKAPASNDKKGKCKKGKKCNK
ncbi:MAG: hypothetical protein K5867_07910 [Bacteroidales bacterium]|nr:hypothetical protein [Bacteroidales bacterium]